MLVLSKIAYARLTRVRGLVLWEKSIAAGIKSGIVGVKVRPCRLVEITVFGYQIDRPNSGSYTGRMCVSRYT